MSVKPTGRTKSIVRELAAGTAKRLLTSGINVALHKIGRDNVLETKSQMTDEPKTGKWYTYKGRRYRASAPGEAPAVRSGALVKSIKYTVSGGNRMEYGDRQEYGRYLEDGTDKMAARPHIAETESRRQEHNKRLLKQAGAKALKIGRGI